MSSKFAEAFVQISVDRSELQSGLKSAQSSFSSFFSNLTASTGGITSVFSNLASTLGSGITSFFSSIASIATGGITGVISSIASIAGGITSFFSNLASTVVGGITSFFSNIASTVVGGITSFFSNIASTVTGGITGFFSSIASTFSGGITSFFSNLASTAGGILLAGGIQGLTDKLRSLAGQFIQTNVDMEQYRLSLGVLLKDQKRANDLIQEIQNFAAVTPFETGGLTQSVQTLKQFGFETEKLMPMMKIIGDQAAASPAGMEQGVYRISLALGQMRAAGKVMGQDLMQLVQQGVPVWEILREESGLTMDELRKQTRSGAIDASKAIEFILNGMAKRTGNMMDVASRSSAGLSSTIADNLDIAFQKIGVSLFEFNKEWKANIVNAMASDEGIAFIDSLTAGMNAIISEVRSVGKSVQPVLLSIFNGLKGVWQKSVPFVMQYAASVRDSIGEAFRNAAGLAKTAWDGVNAFITENSAMLSAWGANSMEIVRNVGSGVLTLFQNIGNIANQALQFVAGIFQDVFGVGLTELFGSTNTSFSDFITNVLEELSIFTSDSGLTWERIKVGFSQAMTAMHEEFLRWSAKLGIVLRAVGRGFVGMLKRLVDSWQTIISVLILMAVVAGQALMAALLAGLQGKNSSDAISAAVSQKMQPLLAILGHLGQKAGEQFSKEFNNELNKASLLKKGPESSDAKALRLLQEKLRKQQKALRDKQRADSKAEELKRRKLEELKRRKLEEEKRRKLVALKLQALKSFDNTKGKEGKGGKAKAVDKAKVLDKAKAVKDILDTVQFRGLIGFSRDIQTTISGKQNPQKQMAKDIKDLNKNGIKVKNWEKFVIRGPARAV